MTDYNTLSKREILKQLINRLEGKDFGTSKFQNGEYYWRDGNDGEWVKMDIDAMNEKELDQEIEELKNWID